MASGSHGLFENHECRLEYEFRPSRGYVIRITYMTTFMKVSNATTVRSLILTNLFGCRHCLVKHLLYITYNRTMMRLRGDDPVDKIL
jgi:hypothetical protein